MSRPFREETEMDETTTRDETTREIERARRNARRFAEMKRQTQAALMAGRPGQSGPKQSVRGARTLLLLRG